ncbi:hypothetical protein AHAS_Ahas07G0164800 [Arachis hypogaea]
MRFSLAVRLIGMAQQSRDQFDQRFLRWHLALDQFPLDAFDGQQPIPGDPVNVDRFITTIGQGENIWWPTCRKEWYDGRKSQFEDGRIIFI